MGKFIYPICNGGCLSCIPLMGSTDRGPTSPPPPFKFSLMSRGSFGETRLSAVRPQGPSFDFLLYWDLSVRASKSWQPHPNNKRTHILKKIGDLSQKEAMSFHAEEKNSSSKQTPTFQSLILSSHLTCYNIFFWISPESRISIVWMNVIQPVQPAVSFAETVSKDER